MTTPVAREVALIVNPSAGGGRAARALPGVETRLRALGVAFEVDATRDIAQARELALAAAQRGRVVVTLSGDGMLGAVAGALREVPGATVGVLPGGRGNDFARVVGIPLDAEAACEVIANGVARPVDLGLAGETPYIGIASVGFDSEANRIANTAPARLGQLVYLYGALGALATWKHATFDIEVDGERRQFTGWSVGACNSKAYGGGMYAAPDAELDDGALDVVYCERTSKATFVGKILPKIFKGEHVHEPSVHVMRGAEVHIEADRPFMVYADGDPVGELPMTFRALPAALQVLLPA
ncbi:MAG: diacylglycerol/lipid kinase family protein [Solirubrobacteraceae bacterium]